MNLWVFKILLKFPIEFAPLKNREDIKITKKKEEFNNTNNNCNQINLS
jgi:hypothetical protein